MKLNILDKRVEGEATCYLCRVNLLDYIESLPDDYKEWDVQRGIVSNKYLDTLIETVLERRHIPPLVLVSEELNVTKGEIDTFRILDGLQRTYRLKLIKGSIDFIENELQKNESFLELSPSKLSRQYSSVITEKGGSINVVRRLLEIVRQNNIGFIMECLHDNEQWMEVWINLTPSEQVEKMLLLNAGHKAVNIKHQVELLFRTLYPTIKSATDDKITLIREKEVSSIRYSKNRKTGEFHFSHIVSALVSLETGKPVTTNADFVQKIQNEQLDLDFNYETIESTCKLLIRLDEKLADIYGEVAVKWLGREVVLTGIMGAIGEYAINNKISLPTSLNIADEIFKINYNGLNIDKFDIARNSLDLSKVNIGNVNKKAVFHAISSLINKEVKIIDWNHYFLGGSNA